MDNHILAYCHRMRPAVVEPCAAVGAVGLARAHLAPPEADYGMGIKLIKVAPGRLRAISA